MSRTIMKGGACVAAYVQNAGGRYLCVARDEERGFNEPVIVAHTQEQARDLIRVLSQLLEELPVEKETRGRKAPIEL